MTHKIRFFALLIFIVTLMAIIPFIVSANECEHNIIHVEAQEPSCHSDGNIEYWYCFNCDQYWLDEVLTNLTVKNMLCIPQLNDETDDDFIEYKAPTCTEDGNYDYWYCDECDSIWNDDYMTNIGLPRGFPVIPALGHNYVDGVCDRCGEKEPVDFKFDDVADGKWYTDAIYYCYNNGYMAGVSETVFGYKDTVTRAMFATILAKIDGADLSAYTSAPFGDVADGKWYTASIAWAAEKEYTAGIGDGIFGYKQEVTREQIAMFFYTYSEKNGVDVSGRADLSVFADYGRIHDWARDAMAWAVEAGLIAGTDENYISPGASATRSEIAVIIMNYTSIINS